MMSPARIVFTLFTKPVSTHLLMPRVFATCAVPFTLLLFIGRHHREDQGKWRVQETPFIRVSPSPVSSFFFFNPRLLLIRKSSKTRRSRSRSHHRSRSRSKGRRGRSRDRRRTRSRSLKRSRDRRKSRSRDRKSRDRHRTRSKDRRSRSKDRR